MNLIKNVSLLAIGAFVFASCNNNNNTKPALTDSTKKTAKPEVKTNTPGTAIKYDSSKRYIFLTWDDGPQPPGTTNCKMAFHNQGVKASFFAVAAHYNIDPRRKRIMDSIRNSYPEFLLCNHSYTHAFKDNYGYFYTHIDSAAKDIELAQKDMQVPLKILRLPGRNTWAGKGEFRGPNTSKNLAKRLDSLGYQIIGWDVEWEFVKGSTPKQTPTELVNTINNKFDIGYTNQPNMLVILAHDRMFSTPQHIDSLNKFISLLKQDSRNVFETIDHYPTVQH